MTPADGDRSAHRGKRPPGGKAGGGRAGRPGTGGGTPAPAIEGLSEQAFAKALVRRMEGCADAERLNARVLQPFIAALEDVCRARGYVLNIYGDTANLVFTGDEEDAETIYQMVEAYLDSDGDET